MKKQRILLYFAIFALFLAAFTGCTAKANLTEKEKQQANSTTVITIVDDLGSRYEFKEPLKRVVSLAPSITEIIFAIGEDSKLVGVTNFCDYPEEARNKTKIGDFFNPNVEEIIKLKPDAVIGVKGVQDSLIKTMKDRQIPVLVFDSTSLDDLASDIEKIGKLFGNNKKAVKVADEIRSIDRKYSLTGKKVFLEINAQPVITAGQNTFISDAIRAAGGVNAGDAIGADYPVVNVEKIVEINPDIYLISKNLGVKPEDVFKRPGFENLECIKNKKVFVLKNDDIIFRPGPRIVEGVNYLHEIIESN